MRGVSGDSPEGGARLGVPRLRLVTDSLGRRGNRPPGTMTRAARNSLHASPEAMPETEARTRSRKSPRWRPYVLSLKRRLTLDALARVTRIGRAEPQRKEGES